MVEAFNRFWSRGAGQKIVVVALISIIVLAIISGLVVIGLKAFPASQANSPVGGRPPTSLPIARPTTAPINPPRLGATLATFTTAYGPVIFTDDTGADNFWVDKAKTILVTAVFKNGTASTIGILGPPSWSNSESLNYCSMFLPAGATQYSQVAEDLDYHSSLGNVVLQNIGEGTCQVFLAG
jgi:hypothetical protein